MAGLDITLSTLRKAGVAGMILAISSGAPGQALIVEESSAEPTDVPEEIIVYGEKSYFQLRTALYAPEEDFYVAYNAVNRSDNYDVTCDKVFSVQAHRRLRQCRANFLKDYQEEVVEVYFGISTSPNLAALRHKERILREDMARLISMNVALQEKFNEFARAKQEFDAHREDRTAKE